MVKSFRSWAWLPCLLLAACAQRDGTVVAEVGEHKIEGNSVRRLVEKLLPGQRTAATGDEARRHYLQVLVDGRLMLLEAEERGLQADETVVKKISDAVDERLIRMYQKNEMASVAPVSEEEAREKFEREGFARERLCSGILAADRATAEAVLAELAGGRSFADVAMEHSLDERSAKQGGVLGFVGLTTIDKLHIPPDLFRTLPADKVSRPIPAGNGAWHVFRFTEERVATFAKYRPYIDGLLREERRLLAERQHLERLRETYKVRLSGVGLAELMDAYRRYSPQELEASGTALYVHDEGEITVARANGMLQVLNLRRALADSAEATYVVNSAVLRPFLMRRAAHESGYADRADIVRLRERSRINAMATRLRELEMANIELSEPDIRSWYNAHPRMFRIERSVTVEEILLATRTEADSAKNALARGKPFGEIVADSRRPDAVRNNGEYHFHPQDAVVYPKLLAAIDQAAAGEWTGPIEVEHGFSVFRVTAREAERIQPFDSVRSRARGLLLREREAAATDELIMGLREKFRTQVVIHERNLREALPDSLISG